jgi:hypothetical protein
MFHRPLFKTVLLLLVFGPVISSLPLKAQSPYLTWPNKNASSPKTSIGKGAAVQLTVGADARA